MSDHVNPRFCFTEQDCRRSLQCYLRQRKKVKSHLAQLFAGCSASGQQLAIKSIENHLAYKVTVDCAIETYKEFGHAVLSPDEAASAQREAAQLVEVGREFENYDKIVPRFKKAKTQTCDLCNGSGLRECSVCNARGQDECECLYEVWDENLPSESIYGKECCELCDGCTHCYKCQQCDGRALIKCQLCVGTGQTIAVPQVQITRVSLRDRQIINRPKELAASLVEEAEGQTMQVADGAPAAVQAAKAQLWQMHSDIKLKPNEVMKDRRLVTEYVPIAEVLYEDKNGNQGTFWVIGISGDFCYCPKLTWTAFCSIMAE